MAEGVTVHGSQSRGAAMSAASPPPARLADRYVEIQIASERGGAECPVGEEVQLHGNSARGVQGLIHVAVEDQAT